MSVRALTVVTAGKEVLRDVAFELGEGEVLGIVGPSGAGKSLLLQAIVNVLPRSMHISKGSIRLYGDEVVGMSEDHLRLVRGERIGLSAQNARAALNPIVPVGEQIVNVLRAHRELSRSAARAKAVVALEEVGIPAAADRFGAYPHEFSGGMLQRVMIAMALACSPVVLLADEPTSGLDVTIQAQILQFLRQRVEAEKLSTILVSRDLGVIARCCDSVAVLFGGEIVEAAPIPQFFDLAEHAISRRLIEAASLSRVRTMQNGRGLKGAGEVKE